MAFLLTISAVVFYNQNMKLFDYLNNYLKENIYPFHMPGNKRVTEYSQFDFTEVEGLDNLYHSCGILKEMTERIKTLYGTKESFVLVNGSTVGILTAITSVTAGGDGILLARNCHKSVYNAVELWDLLPYYILPRCDENGICMCISPDEVEKKLKDNSEIKACVITSPTYEGVVSDIKAIAEICHSYNVILIVDEAHGSHLGFSDYFPDSAIGQGADIVIQSTHKTLTSLTGTGLLHICSDRVDLQKIKKRYQTFQTSSPNYILMASVDECICNIIEKGDSLFAEYTKKLDDFYKKTESLEKLKIFRGDAATFDRGKIVILTTDTNISGTTLQTTLREKYKIETEMATVNYCLAMTSINDTSEGFARFVTALLEIDKSLVKSKNKTQAPKCLPEMVCTPAKAENLMTEDISPEKASGRVAMEYIYAYPPGIPIIVPGEKFSEAIVDDIKNMLKNGVNVISESNKLPLSVVCAIDT